MKSIILRIIPLFIITSVVFLYRCSYQRFITRIYTVDAFEELDISSAQVKDLKSIALLISNNKLTLMQSVHNHCTGYPIDDFQEMSELRYWTRPWLINKYLNKSTLAEKQLLLKYESAHNNPYNIYIDDINYIPKDNAMSFTLKSRLVIDLDSEEWIVEHKVVNSMNILARSRWPQYRFYRSRSLEDGWSYIITAHRREEHRSGDSSMLLWFKRTMLSREQRAVAETLRGIDKPESIHPSS